MRQPVAGGSSFPVKIGPAKPDMVGDRSPVSTWEDPMSKTRLMGAAGLALAFALSAQAASAQTAHAGHAAPASANAPQIHPWGFDLNGRDLTVKPGDDFNAYANGTYLRETEIPSDKARFGPFDVLYENAQSQLKSIIETSAANPTNANAQKVGALYASFMDEARVNQLGAQPLAADLAAVRAVADPQRHGSPDGRKPRRLRRLPVRRRCVRGPAKPQPQLGLYGPGRPRPARPRLLPEGRLRATA